MAIPWDEMFPHSDGAFPVTRVFAANFFRVTPRTITDWVHRGAPVLKRASKNRIKEVSLFDLFRWRADRGDIPEDEFMRIVYAFDLFALFQELHDASANMVQMIEGGEDKAKTGFGMAGLIVMELIRRRVDPDADEEAFEIPVVLNPGFKNA